MGTTSNTAWAKSPWEDAENGQALWDSPEENRTPSTAVGSINLGTEQSTDEGSEAKGSESDDSSEGYLVSNQQFPGSPPTILSHMSTNAAGLCGAGIAGSMVSPNMQVPAHTGTQHHATAVYTSYLSSGSFLATHGFSGNDVASHFGYEVSHPLNSSFQAIGGGVTPSVMDSSAAGVPVGDGAEPGGVPSLGSYAHLSGQCSRCCFHPKGRCANGYSCEFCHYDHDKRPRNGKKKRYRRQLDGTSDDGMCFQVDGPN